MQKPQTSREQALMGDCNTVRGYQLIVFDFLTFFPFHLTVQ